MKYIMVIEGDLETPIMFPDYANHGCAARGRGLVVSAGFFDIGYIDGELSVKVWGESSSLRVTSRYEDAERIKQCFCKMY